MASDVPLFRKRKPEKEKARKMRKRLLGIALALLLVFTLLAGMSGPGRWEFDCDEIRRYDVWNQKTETLRWSQMKEYRLETFDYSVRSGKLHGGIRICLKAEDGRVWEIEDFRDAEAFLQVDTILLDLGVSRSLRAEPVSLERFLRQEQLPQELADRLRRAFGMPEKD